MIVTYMDIYPPVYRWAGEQMERAATGQRVAVAMSGGVDSSVAAALLLQQGHQVFGLTMIHQFNEESAAGSLADARAVCERLGIPHHVMEIREQFKELVIDDFVQEYLAGRTPNPCTTCNAKIKWGVLMQAAMSKGADKFATGHYARVSFHPGLKRYVLFKSLNEGKDQSYALWKLTQRQLAKTVVPLGELEKTNVRRIAADLGLAAAHRKESQEICFIPDDDYHRFIQELAADKKTRIEPGLFLDQNGLVVGEHLGTAFYTIGQRKGLGLALGRPVYVTEIDAEKNTIIVGDKKDLLARGLVADQVNWISVERPLEGMPVEARIRYKDPGYGASIQKVEKETVTVVFDEPRSAVTPGQSAVFYHRDQVVGGGVIVSAIK